MTAEQTFQRLVAQLDYPMFIATVAAGGERAGCLIGFATQCSIHPPRFLAGISDKNRTYRVAQGAAGSNSRASRAVRRSMDGSR